MLLDSSHALLSPWKEFLAELDGKLTEPVALHCIGGFVVCFFYGLQRITADIDYHTAVTDYPNLEDVGGQGSALANKYKVWLQRVTVTNLSEDYDARLAEMFPGRFHRLRLFAPDPYDYILSKLERNSTKDRDDADHVFKMQQLDSRILRERYEKELRPHLANETRHDRTFELWIEIFETKGK